MAYERHVGRLKLGDSRPSPSNIDRALIFTLISRRIFAIQSRPRQRAGLNAAVLRERSATELHALQRLHGGPGAALWRPTGLCVCQNGLVISSRNADLFLSLQALMLLPTGQLILFVLGTSDQSCRSRQRCEGEVLNCCKSSRISLQCPLLAGVVEANGFCRGSETWHSPGPRAFQDHLSDIQSWASLSYKHSQGLQSNGSHVQNDAWMPIANRLMAAESSHFDKDCLFDQLDDLLGRSGTANPVEMLDRGNGDYMRSCI
jgi:hypothetical protein